MNYLELKKDLINPIVSHRDMLIKLKKYKNPNNKIARLIKDEIIYPLKKGLYVFNQTFSNIRVDKEIIANLLYGPSYISLDFALASYGLIPEKVNNITSVTSRRKKIISNCFGVFTYQSIPINFYAESIKIGTTSGDNSYFIASPEKALFDKIYLDRNARIDSLLKMQEYLEEDIRFDIKHFLEISDMNSIINLTKVYQHKKIDLFLKMIQKLKGKI